MKIAVAFLLVAQAAAPAQTERVVVPRDLENRLGNGGAAIPFNIGVGQSARLQQVYSASEFVGFGANGLLITGIRFRPNEFPSGRSFAATLPDVQFNLSTTMRGPDALSAVFSENIGGHETLVYQRGPLSLRSIGGHGADVFDIVVIFDTPFLYNPSSGNLLLDIRNFAGGNTTFIDGHSSFGDSVSLVRATTGDQTGGVDSLTGLRETGGLVTLFEFIPVPALTVSLQSSNLVFRWANRSAGCSLQQSPVLGLAASWQPTGGTVMTNGSYVEVTLPLDTQVRAKFFRLALPPSASSVAEPQLNGASSAVSNLEP